MTAPAFDRFHFRIDGGKGSGFSAVAIPPEISERADVYEIPSEPRVFPSGELTAEMQIRRSTDFDQSFYEWVQQAYATGDERPQRVCVRDEVGSEMCGYIRAVNHGETQTTITVMVTEQRLAPWYRRGWWHVRTWVARMRRRLGVILLAKAPRTR
ncbi:MAG: hypothetical protein WC406_08425 [Methanoregula sp.]